MRVAGLLLGPMLRYVGETEATVWVETDAPCDVEVNDAHSPTFQVEGHHFALVELTGFEPGSWTEYEIRLDGGGCGRRRARAFRPARSAPSRRAVRVASRRLGRSVR